MHYRHVLAALWGSLSLSAAAPLSERDATPAEKGLKHQSKRQLGALIQPNIQISNTQITVVNQNLGIISQLAQLAEAQLAALVQSQIQLVLQLETIKNNIRINHFKARFAQVNTVIVTVTNIVDARVPTNINRRYLLNQLRIDNGVPDKELVVMVTQKEEMTIHPTPTINARNPDASATLSGGFPEQTPSSPVSKIVNFDPTAPFALLNQSLILPYNTSAPTNPLVFEDPANIIFAGQHNLLVESLGSLQQDCIQLATANSFINQAIQLSLFSSLQQAAAAQLSGIQIGGGIPIIPPDVLLSHPDLASQYTSAIAQETATATETFPSETAHETVTESAQESATETIAETSTEEAATSTEAAAAAAETSQAGHGGKAHKGNKGDRRR
ncbi:hypothetical protein V8F20_000593 [Naviculisporaceae sp. PSN 640]